MKALQVVVTLDASVLCSVHYVHLLLLVEAVLHLYCVDYVVAYSLYSATIGKCVTSSLVALCRLGRILIGVVRIVCAQAYGFARSSLRLKPFGLPASRSLERLLMLNGFIPIGPGSFVVQLSLICSNITYDS